MKPLSILRKYSSISNLKSVFTHSHSEATQCDVKPGISKCHHHNDAFISAYKRLIDGNLKYVAEKKETDPEYFKN